MTSGTVSQTCQAELLGSTATSVSVIDALLSDPTYVRNLECNAEFVLGRPTIAVSYDGEELIAQNLTSDSTDGSTIDYRDQEQVAAVLAATERDIRESMPNASDAEIAAAVEQSVETQFNENIVTSFLGHADDVGDYINDAANSSPIKAYLAVKGIQTAVGLATGGPLGAAF